MRLYLASDHAGFDLKRSLLDALAAEGREALDLGATALDPADDYPDFITPLAERVAAEPGALGVAIGGSGEGEAMAANRVKGARAAVFYGPRSATGAIEIEGTTAGGDGYDLVRLARAHNDANILSLGARFLTDAEALEAVRIFVATPFSGLPRHARRLAKF